MSRRGCLQKIPRPSKVILRPEEWPEIDRALWKHAQRPGDVLEKSGRVYNWKPNTVKNVEYSYGHWLKWLSNNHQDCLIVHPLERVTRGKVRLYVENMRERLSPFTVQMHLQRLGQVMTALSETGEFRWLFRAANRSRPKSVHNKRAKIRTPYELAELGFRLMKKSEEMSDSWHAHRSITYRNGLLIALLAYRPIRLANLAMINIGQHLQRTADGFIMTFTPCETKQNETLEFSLPQSLIMPLETYLAAHRPTLLSMGPHSGTAGTRLWVSRDGGCLTATAIRQQIIAETKSAFGKGINPHLFRDCAATAIAIDDPEHAHLIAKILGHSSMATSEMHYNQARTVDAAEQYHQALAQARRRHSPAKQQAPRIAQ